MAGIIKRDDLLYPELSYELIGCAFDVHSQLGGGHPEAVYQKAFAIALRKRDIAFKEQDYYPLRFEGEIIGKGYMDFLVEDKIVVELKKANHFSKANIDQVLKYLVWGEKKLGIIINFGHEGVRSKRVINIHNSPETAKI